MAKSEQEILTEIAVIGNETEKSANTNERVANTLLDMFEYSSETDAKVEGAVSAYLGDIPHSAIAPTPDKSGWYKFSTSGVVSWLSGTPTVSVGDQLSVVYANSEYTYTLIDTSYLLSDEVGSDSSSSSASSKAVSKAASVLNLDVLFPLSTGYYDKATAKNVVPAYLRKRLTAIMYTMLEGETQKFITEQFIGANSSVWSNQTYWRDIATSEDIASVRSDLTDKFTELEDGIKYDFSDNGIVNNTEGAAIYVQTNADWKHAKIRCASGARFTIYGNGGASLRVWSTADENGVTKRTSASSKNALTTPEVVTIEDGECWLIVNTNTADLDKSSVRLDNIAKVVEEISIAEKAKEKFGNFKSTFAREAYLNADGAVVASDDYLLTDYLPISKNDEIQYRVYHSTSGGTAAKPLIVGGGIYCYDSNKNYIGRYTTTHATEYMFGTLNLSMLPEGTAYFRCYIKRGGEGYLYGVRENVIDDPGLNAGDIEELDSRIGSAESNIVSIQEEIQSINTDTVQLRSNLSETTELTLRDNTQYGGSVGAIFSEYNVDGWYAAKHLGNYKDKYEIKGVGGISIRLWMTLDENGVVKRIAPASQNSLSEPAYVTLEEGERYICMNSNVSNSSLHLLNIATSFQNYKDNGYLLQKYKNFKSTFGNRGYLNSSGVFVLDYGYLLTGFLPIDSSDVIKYKVYHSTSGGTGSNPLVISGGIYCFDEYYNYIGRYTIDHIGSSMSGQLSISDLPSGTKYFRAFRKDDDSDCYIYGCRDEVIDESSYNTVMILKSGYSIYRKLTSSTSINSAINELHDLGGGVMQFGYIENTGTEIILNHSDVTLKGSGINHTIFKGTSCNFVVGDNVAIASVSDMTFVNGYKCKKTSKLSCVNVLVGSDIINGLAPSIYKLAASDTGIGIKNLAYEVIDTTTDASVKINSILTQYDILYLFVGTYNTNSAVVVSSNNSIISFGDGRAAIIRATNGYAVMTADNSTNTYVYGLTSNKLINLQKNSYNGRVVNSIVNGSILINDITFSKKGTNVIKIGIDVSSLTAALALTVPSLNIPSDVKYEYHVYGVVEETITSTINILNTIFIEGKTSDAELKFIFNSASSTMMFRDYNSVPNKSIVKNITISSYGIAGGYQYATVLVRSNFCRFEKCNFLNFQSYTDSYDPSLDTNNVALTGDRKHGCIIEINEDTNVYDNDCELEFHDCTAVGSPYGHKNCRGWYILKGSPRLYNCKGIGGGVGRYGYGIICHHSSKPYLYNCIGIGSPYGWELANGIQFQMSTQAKLYNCIGFGGVGYKHKITDGNIVNQGVITGQSHGFGFLMNVKPTLINCIGYAGDGDDSAGIYLGYDSNPTIIGGVYGKDIKTYCTPFIVDSGTSYMSLNIGNDNRELELVDVGIRDLIGMTSGQKVVFKNSNNEIILEANQITQQQNAIIFIREIHANDTITCHVVDSDGNDVINVVKFDIIVRYKVSNKMYCVKLEADSSPRIYKSILEGNSQADGVILDTTSQDYIIADCIFNIAQERNVIMASSTKNEINVVNCVLSNNNTDNIAGFASVSELGSNKVFRYI